MQTDIPANTPFVVRERGGYAAWRTTEKGDAYTGIGRPLQSGDVVHFAVWKGNRLESRKTYTLRTGDVEWVSSGILSVKHQLAQAESMQQDMDEMVNVVRDLLSGKTVTLPKGPERPSLPVTEEHYIFKNRFGGACPVWLRQAR